MTYQKPRVVTLGNASKVIQGIGKLDLFAFDPFCPDIIGCSLFLPAYELDE